MSYPADYRYTTQHEWISAPAGGDATLGITDYAQQQLGDLVFVELPKVGDRLTAGQSLGTVESVKAVSEVYAPASGTVTAVNEELAKAPELINQDAHGKGWLIKARLSAPTELDKLMDRAAYEHFLAESEPA